MKPRVLIAEDEESLANVLQLNLRMEGYDVTLCRSGQDALNTFSQQPSVFDIALLDVMMPGISGFDLCAKLRQSRPGLPVIFLTARSEVADRREGLRLGADDYITKPFDLEELLLRVKNLIRRSTPVRDAEFTFAGGTINFRTYEITGVSGDKHTLSRREIGLLELLTGEPGRVISRDEIIHALWDPSENASSRTIDNYILAFRKLFEQDPRVPRHFHSVRGVGYRFTA
jgi:two-component system alkaline phosphatase synthesis response regulator PhoP